MQVECITPVLNVSDIAASVAWFEKWGWKKKWDWGTPPALGRDWRKIKPSCPED